MSWNMKTCSLSIAIAALTAWAALGAGCGSSPSVKLATGDGSVDHQAAGSGAGVDGSAGTSGAAGSSTGQAGTGAAGAGGSSAASDGGAGTAAGADGGSSSGVALDAQDAQGDAGKGGVDAHDAPVEVAAITDAAVEKPPVIMCMKIDYGDGVLRDYCPTGVQGQCLDGICCPGCIKSRLVPGGGIAKTCEVGTDDMACGAAGEACKSCFQTRCQPGGTNGRECR
jgi:hypothetical protein